MSAYRLDVGKQRIVWGVKLDPVAGETLGPEDAAVKPSAENGFWEWDLPNGVYTAREIVKALGVLLEAIDVQLGEAANREALLANIEKTLATAGRETALPLGALALHDHGRLELSTQASRIGETLAQWARAYDGEAHGLRELGGEVLGRLVFRSRCDHHLWTHEVTDMLTGPASGPSVMQLFNEYLHEIVLLRDALLPFENWQEVPLELTARQTRGLRYTEEAHAAFLSQLLARPLDHKSLVHYAASLLAPELSADGYGFQYRHGTILPASLGTELAEAPRYLLRWYPVRMVESDERDAIAFAYEYSDYYTAPRSQLGTGSQESGGEEAETGLGGIVEASLQASLAPSGQAVISFQLRANADTYAVDLGQIFRGHRFHYRTPPADEKPISPSPIPEKSDIAYHAAAHVFSLSGLVTSEAGTHQLASGGNELVARALLGKLYPENVILLERGDADELEAAKDAGKRFGAKFLLLAGQDQARLSSIEEASAGKLSI
ncbi:hypothetical protein [Cohnella sp. JJ-181]|uniref:hypothetical protein n=1 Tax=Cohnella rhizoplanae TaxID=2974897 RepID=UPI0022FF925F|nr:hypothetical protein [Cohnella sp. JJ-181]CAI6085641.1 hypothetical protein COHCIP112018_04740 [Cohnella sp. JJ-181]